jgi:hypothetical protein
LSLEEDEFDVPLLVSDEVSLLVSDAVLLLVSDGLPQDESKKAPRAKERNILFTCLLVSMFKIIAKA